MKANVAIGILVYAMGSSPLAFAADLDVPAARDAYERQQRIAEQAEQLYEQTRQVFEGAQSDLLRARDNEKRAQQQLDRERQELSAIESEISTYESQIFQLESDLRRDRNELRFVETQIPRLRTENQDLKDQAQRIQKRIENLDNRIAKLEKEDPKPPELKQAKEERQDARQRLQRVQQDANRVRNELQSAQNNKQQLDSAIQNWERQLNNAQRSLADARQSRTQQARVVDDARFDVQQKASEVGYAQGRVDSLRPSYQVSLNSMQAEQRRARELYNYYQAVIANYNQALSQVYAQAEAEAIRHSGQEAANRSAQPARQAGEIDARTEGVRKAVADRAARDEARGYEEGGQVAASAPDVKVPYERGIQSGQNTAVSKAKSESFPKGYNDALEALLASAPSGTQVIDLKQGFPSDPGTSGNHLDDTTLPVGFVAAPAFTGPSEPSFEPPSAQVPSLVVPAPIFSQSSPPCTNLPLIEFESLCRDRYRNTYRDQFVRSYQNQYAATYRAVFSQDVVGVYQTTLAQNDPKAFRTGKDQGAFDQGVLDGFAGRFPSATAQMLEEGKDALAVRLTQSYLLVYRSGKLVDENEDGVMAPGEKALLEIVVDNYGQKPSPFQDLKIALLGTEGLVASTVTTQALPALEGETRTTLKGVLDATIQGDTAGTSLSLTARLTIDTGGDTVVLGKIQLGEVIQFPLELTELFLPHPPKVDEEIEAELTFTNRANRGFPGGELALSTLPKLVEVNEENPVALAKVDVGDSITVPVKIQPGIWVGENTAVNFLAEVTDSDGGVITQRFAKVIPIDRNASVRLFNSSLQPEPDALFEANAGGYVTFYAQFTYHAKTTLPGTFEIRAAKTSDPGLALISNSTVAVNYGSFWPNRKADPIRFTYRIPQSLKGQRGWIMITAKEGARTLHAQMVYVDVK